MSTNRTCGHDRKPLVVSTQQELDIKLPDLGHPDDPGLWDRIYRHCTVGTLVCADCDDASVNRYLYLGLTRFDGHPRSGAVAPWKDVPRAEQRQEEAPHSSRVHPGVQG